jgi:uncharacterized membrane protein
MSKDKPLPLLTSDEEAEGFVSTADLASYDLSTLTPTRFEFQPRKDHPMTALLIFAVVVILVAWLITMVLAQIPGVPVFVSTAVWVIAVVVVLLRLVGYA